MRQPSIFGNNHLSPNRSTGERARVLTCSRQVGCISRPAFPRVARTLGPFSWPKRVIISIGWGRHILRFADCIL